MPIVKQFFKGLDVRSNALAIDSQRASNCDNVWVNTSDELVNRPFFSNFTFGAGALPGYIRGLQTASFKTFKDHNHAFKYVGPFLRYMLLYVSGSDDPIGTPTSKRGAVVKANSTPAVGSVMQEGADPTGENATGNNYHIMKAQYSVLFHRSGAPFIKDSPVKGVVFDQVMYMLGWFGLWKSDGLVTQRAGCPYGLSAISSGSGAARYFRTFIAHFDFSAQWVFGDYYQQYKATNGQGAKTVGYDDTLDSTLNQQSITSGFFDTTYILSTNAAWNIAPILGDPTTATEIVLQSTVNRVEVGDWLTVFEAVRPATGRSSSRIFKVKVKAKTGTTVTLDMTDSYVCDFKDGGGFRRAEYPYCAQPSNFTPNNAVTFGETYVVTSNLCMITYASTAETSGFRFIGIGAIDPDLQSTHRVTTDVVDAANPLNQYYNYGAIPEHYPFTDKFENCYDEAKVKGNLPTNTIAGTSGDPSTEFETETGTDIRYLAKFNNILLAADSKYVYYSSPSVGSLVENFDPLDFFTVGDSEDGPIVGLFANDDYIVVHREKQSHYVTGNLTTGAFRSKSLDHDNFGALGHWGQIRLLGQDFFVSKKGAHAISRGASTVDLGEFIEPIIRNNSTALFGSFPRLSEEIPQVIMADDDLKNHVYVFYAHGATSSVLVFNYRIKEWFRWTLPLTVQTVSGRIIGGAAGLNGALWTSNGTSLWVENTAIVSPDAAFGLAQWASVMRDDGGPSIEKLYNYLKLFSVYHDAISFDASVKVQYDWESSGFTDQGALQLPNSEVSPPQGFNLTDLLGRNAYAFQWSVSSPGYLRLQGYELNVEAVSGEINR